MNTDFLFDLRSRIWKFAEDNSYDRIVDCTGGILSRGSYDRQVEERLLNEIQRVLKPGGIFYADRRVNYVLHKERNLSLKKIDKTITIRNPEIVLLGTRFIARMHYVSNVAENTLSKIKINSK